MKETTSQQVRLGFFIVVASAIFGAAIYFIGNKQSLFGRAVPLYAVFNNINGLQPGNNVRYSGVNAGTVRRIEMLNDTAIRVEMLIERQIFKHINTDAVAAVGSDGLVGSMVINIMPGTGRTPVQKGAEIQSQGNIRTQEILETLSITNENAALLSADLLRISNQVNRGNGTAGLLLRDSVMADDLKQTLHYLKISSQETSKAVNRLNSILASLDQKDNVLGVVRDTAVAAKFRNIIENLDKSGKAIEKASTNIDALVDEYRDGEGALKYLVKDPKSARELDSVITNINSATNLLKQDLEALKHSFLLRGYFKKQAKAKKDN